MRERLNSNTHASTWEFGLAPLCNSNHRNRTGAKLETKLFHKCGTGDAVEIPFPFKIMQGRLHPVRAASQRLCSDLSNRWFGILLEILYEILLFSVLLTRLPRLVNSRHPKSSTCGLLMKTELTLIGRQPLWRLSDYPIT